jgi:NhaA family Na+:H+ antiporter
MTAYLQVSREDWSARRMRMADDEIRRPWSSSDRTIPRVVVRPLQEFLQTSISSAVLLFAAVVVALVWANVGGSYERFWHTPAELHMGNTIVGADLRFWVNDGLMTLFFLLVGVEIKREFTTGELRRLRVAALPALAAVGGMVVPALVYVAVTSGDGDAARGWGVPMATDIALALGALALAARHAPASLKPLLLTLAIVDDIGAIVVIAVFYSSGGEPAALLVALGLIGVIALLQAGHVRSLLAYVVVGAGLWYATYEAGVHPTIAGVVLGLLTPSEPFQRPAAVSAEARRTAEETRDDPDPPDADAPAWLELAALSKEAVSPLARVEHALLPWSSFMIVPLFALANAGVQLSGEAIRGALTGGVGVGILLGLVLGKPVGILAASGLATRVRLADRPSTVGWVDLTGMGATAGIGFTVALFIAELAFPSRPELLAEAKVAILLASASALVAGQILLRLGRPPQGSSLAEQTIV